MTELTFQQPGFAWLLPAAALAMLVWRRARRRHFVAFTTATWLQPARHRASVLRRLPSVVVALALVLITIALMDPVLPYSEAQVRAQGLDIVLVLDLSKSMLEPMSSGSGARPQAPPAASADPMEPAPPKTRLETTKEALRSFIAQRRDDRIGLIVFSDHPYVVSPLTFDYPYLRRYVDLADDQILRGEGLTAIGDGILLANYLLARQSKEERVGKAVLVFTDGVYNIGRDPVEVLAESAAASIRVHVVGIDLESRLKETQDVRRLIDAVGQYGGRYFDADTPEALQAASNTLNTLERGPLTNTVTVRNAPVFTWFALPALVLLVLALALQTVPYFAELT